MTSLLALLRAHADRSPRHPAILAPGREAASYEALVRQVVAVSECLREATVSPADRVALALPNGPELAVAFLGTVATAVCAPLAPDQPRAQLESELAGLRASALVVARGHETEARGAAATLGIPVIELEASEVAGAFTLTRHPVKERVAAMRGEDTDAALLLFTSGTTSKPKLVPLTEQSLLRSAANVAAALQLGAADRCLNVMPLFHIHGLVAGLLAPIAAGGSVVCTPGFRAPDVLGWIAELRPTWYTAVPTIHQAMLDVVRQRAGTGHAVRSAFRVVRSSSAALPVRVMEELEEVFGAPVIEAYGMTEAAHQMTSNPLPPEARKPGSVGTAAGPDVAVLDDGGRVLPARTVGEIVIRGPTVTAGYLDNPAANAAVFVDGWFRTGDQGRFDDDGYLTITGRLKEIINRGGEKVAPREVDEALLEHPDVVHAVAFAIPHSRLGEEVGAAVVLREGAQVTAAQLRVFVSDRLARFKVPRRVVVIDEIPRGRTGKLERTSLPERLGLNDASASQAIHPHVGPTDDVERALVAIWQRVLGDDEAPSIDADFFELGGDSLHATELLVEIEDAFDRRLPATVFFTCPTVRDMADALREPPDARSGVSVVRVQPDGSRPPLFCLLRGGSVVTVRHFAHALGSDQPIFGLWIPSMHGTRDTAGSVEEIAAACADAIRRTQPDGPYFLFGHSLGGVVIYETARQLAARGQRIGLVVLADSAHPRIVNAEWRRRRSARYRARKLLSQRGPAIVARRVRRVVGRERPTPVVYVPGTDVPADWAAAVERERHYVPGPAPGPLAIFATHRYLEVTGCPDLGWAPLLDKDWGAYEVPGNHDTMIGEPHVHVLAARLGECLRGAQAELGISS